MPHDALDTLLDTMPGLWKGRRANGAGHTLPSGHARLDAHLPGGGWPIGALTEVLTAHPGLGELSLLLPALARLGADGQWVVLVDPPWIPYPPALRARQVVLERLLLVRTGDASSTLWACEQALRNGRGGAVLAWPRAITFPRLRRLQLAAREQGKLGFVFRPESAVRETSPAALRLQLEHGAAGATRVRVVKCRGSHPPAPVELRFSAYANPLTHTRGHAPQHPIDRTLLAGDPAAAPRPGPAHPRPARPAAARRGQRRGAAPRTDH
jgi:cell division inhibitor SulA/protein ImuA